VEHIDKNGNYLGVELWKMIPIFAQAPRVLQQLLFRLEL
jgi:hypothetical protein